MNTASSDESKSVGAGGMGSLGKDKTADATVSNVMANKESTISENAVNESGPSKTSLRRPSIGDPSELEAVEELRTKVGFDILGRYGTPLFRSLDSLPDRHLTAWQEIQEAWKEAYGIDENIARYETVLRRLAEDAEFNADEASAFIHDNTEVPWNADWSDVKDAFKITHAVVLLPHVATKRASNVVYIRPDRFADSTIEPVQLITYAIKSISELQDDEKHNKKVALLFDLQNVNFSDQQLKTFGLAQWKILVQLWQSPLANIVDVMMVHASAAFLRVWKNTLKPRIKTFFMPSIVLVSEDARYLGNYLVGCKDHWPVELGGLTDTKHLVEEFANYRNIVENLWSRVVIEMPKDPNKKSKIKKSKSKKKLGEDGVEVEKSSKKKKKSKAKVKAEDVESEETATLEKANKKKKKKGKKSDVKSDDLDDLMVSSHVMKSTKKKSRSKKGGDELGDDLVDSRHSMAGKKQAEKDREKILSNQENDDDNDDDGDDFAEDEFATDSPDDACQKQELDVSAAGGVKNWNDVVNAQDEPQNVASTFDANNDFDSPPEEDTVSPSAKVDNKYSEYKSSTQDSADDKDNKVGESSSTTDQLDSLSVDENEADEANLATPNTGNGSDSKKQISSAEKEAKTKVATNDSKEATDQNNDTAVSTPGIRDVHKDHGDESRSESISNEAELSTDSTEGPKAVASAASDSSVDNALSDKAGLEHPEDPTTPRVGAPGQFYAGETEEHVPSNGNNTAASLIELELVAKLGASVVDRYGPYQPKTAVRSILHNLDPSEMSLYEKIKETWEEEWTLIHPSDTQPWDDGTIFFVGQFAKFELEESVELLRRMNPVHWQSCAKLASISSMSEDMQCNAVAPLPEVATKLANDIIYILPAKFERTSDPLRLITYTLRCMLDRYGDKPMDCKLALLMNLEGFQFSPKQLEAFPIKDWISLVQLVQGQNGPLRATQVLFVNPSDSFLKVWDTTLRQHCPGTSWMFHMIEDARDIKKFLKGKCEDKLPDDLPFGQKAMHDLVTNFLEYRQALEREVNGDNVFPVTLKPDGEPERERELPRRSFSASGDGFGPERRLPRRSVSASGDESVPERRLPRRSFSASGDESAPERRLPRRTVSSSRSSLRAQRMESKRSPTASIQRFESNGEINSESKCPETNENTDDSPELPVQEVQQTQELETDSQHRLRSNRISRRASLSSIETSKQSLIVTRPRVRKDEQENSDEDGTNSKPQRRRSLDMKSRSVFSRSRLSRAQGRLQPKSHGQLS